jgi:hypothetical protein
MWTVTRQRQWPDAANLVEISAGGLDYTNPDALTARYSGEFETYADPREAVEVALEIVRAWRRDSPGVRIEVGHGATAGMTMPFDSCTFKSAREWAKKAWANLPKCPGCGEPMPDDKRKFWHANDWDGLEYCSEDCATRAAEFDAEQETEFEA